MAKKALSKKSTKKVAQRRYQREVFIEVKKVALSVR